MKRLLTILLASLLVFSVSAKKYKHSLGLGTGMAYGVSYKTMVAQHFTIMADVNYGFSFVGGDMNGVADFFGGAANFAFQGDAAQGQNIDLDWFAGGGTQFGAAGNFSGGKWGFNAVGGIEINFVNAPIAITADFRPGYSLAFFPGGGGDIEYDPIKDEFVEVGGGGGMMLMHMFDASINFGIRYTF
ncbi:MAG: hypothetical protein IJ776_07295 [Paludibacteraceae bacterium]|nr:hypothetical protein [Paludibacteraceae bacterium]